MTRSSRRRSLVIAAIAALLVASPAFAASTVGTADVFASDGSLSAGAVDSNGKSYVVFLRETQPGLWFATDASGSWVTTQIDTQSSYTQPALAIDGQGKVHIAIGNEGTTPGIYYITNRTGTWTGVRLLTNSYDRQPAIAVDPLGEAHVVVAQTGADESNYFTNRRGYWVGRRLVACTEMHSIALDAQRRVHIACAGSATTGQGIYQLTDVSGAWAIETVTTAWADTPIISTGGGGLRIAFQGVSPGGVYVATRGASSWSTVQIPQSVLYLRSFLVDPSGKSHLIVAGDTTSYVTNASGSWVAKPSPTGQLSRDGSGKLHVIGGSTALVHYVVGSAGLASTTVGATASYDSSHPSLAVDGAGVSHITYWLKGVINPGIRYGTFNGSTWTASTVRAGDGTDPVIAAQPDGTVHLAYLAAGGTQLWYGRRSSGTWTWSQVASTTGQFACPAIAVSTTGHAYVSVTRTTTVNGFITIRPVILSDRTGSWVSKDLPATTDPGCTSVAANAADKVYVAYLYGTQPAFETDASGSYARTAFGTGGDTNPQVALDGSGHVYLAYTRPGNYDSTSVGVFLRTNATGTWVTTSVSRLASATGALSMDVTGDGHVALAIDGFTWAPFVYLVTNRTGSWITTQLQTGVARTLDVAFAPDGKLRLVESAMGAGAVYIRE